MSLPEERDVMTKTMTFASKGELKAVIDPNGPFDFTTDGVRAKGLNPRWSAGELIKFLG